MKTNQNMSEGIRKKRKVKSKIQKRETVFSSVYLKEKKEKTRDLQNTVQKGKQTRIRLKTGG